MARSVSRCPLNAIIVITWSAVIFIAKNACGVVDKSDTRFLVVRYKRTRRKLLLLLFCGLKTSQSVECVLIYRGIDPDGNFQTITLNC